MHWEIQFSWQFSSWLYAENKFKLTFLIGPNILKCTVNPCKDNKNQDDLLALLRHIQE